MYSIDIKGTNIFLAGSSFMNISPSSLQQMFYRCLGAVSIGLWSYVAGLEMPAYNEFWIGGKQISDWQISNYGAEIKPYN